MTPLSRRGFLFGAAATLAVIRTPGLIMPIHEWVPRLWGDGIHDDTEALEAVLRHETVKDRSGVVQFDGNSVLVDGGHFKINRSVRWIQNNGLHSSLMNSQINGGVIEFITEGNGLTFSSHFNPTGIFMT